MTPPVIDAFQRLVQHHRLPDRLGEDGALVRVGRPPDGAASALSAGLLDAGVPVVVVTDTPGAADSFCEDLRGLIDPASVYCFPQREALPYEETDPHLEISAQRSEAMAALLDGRARVLVTTARGLIERSPLPAAGERFQLELEVGARCIREDLLSRLEHMGFEQVHTLRDVGEVAVRGAIVDVFPYGEAQPVRVELWDGEIASLRRFDPFTQRSVARLDRVEILPIAIRETDGPVRPGSPLEILPPSAVLLLATPERIEARQARLWEETVVARRRSGSVTPPGDVVVEPGAARDLMIRRRRVELILDGEADLDLGIAPPPAIERDMGRLVEAVGAARADGTPALIYCDNEGQLERLEEILAERGSAALAASVTLAIGTLSGGFRLEAPPLLVLTDHEIFRRTRRYAPRGRFRGSATLDSIASIRPGDYVVHMDHGIGRFRGVERVEVQGETIETLEIEYADAEILRLPHYRLDLLERYSAGEDGARPPQVHKLGGKRWKQLKRKTESAIEETAVELLQLYARRQVADGHAFAPETPWQREMEASFLYDETPDQLRAWYAVRHDMEEREPMDRLVCGDVGFGKTEIAMRAAFKAVQDGKQVALLAPTTVLADQHLRTFRERIAAFPIRIESLSRFQTPAEQTRIAAGLASGEVDIVVGTHRLLSGDVAFDDLGLLIVDEEQRFGVRQKERLKELREAVDVLTLTATPIPRTLHLAIGGIRDLSLIRTPPANRRPIITHVLEWNDAVLEDALQRELDRGGQTFFVHDRVDSIEPLVQRVRGLVPDARVEFAHGQMGERHLAATMRAFADRDIDVLVCTSIIENGLDVSTANTMIVHRADRFGLAQLYQLRGRIGRSHRRAYCYLLLPPNVTRDAERRLRVLEQHTELGAGYHVAMRDLELRGAGNLLGSEQSGFASAVGLDTYQRLVASTVKRLKGDEPETRERRARAAVAGDSYLPDDYVVDNEQKMHLYRRLSRLADREEVADFRDELRDRFGPPPAPVERLLDAAELRILGDLVEAKWIRVGDREARITFRERATPQLGVLKGALADRQLDVEVRRIQPLSLVLRRAGTEPLASTLVDALRLLARAEGAPVGAT